MGLLTGPYFCFLLGDYSLESFLTFLGEVDGSLVKVRSMSFSRLLYANRSLSDLP
jgi:hypothetical protein